MKIDGGCHCGHITYEAEINPDDVIICHCNDCQILSGSAYRTVVMAPESSFVLKTGSIKTYIKTAESGNLREQNFCPQCGTQLYATSVGEGDRVFGIRVGTSNQRDKLPPKGQYYNIHAQDWVQDLSGIKNLKFS